MMSRVLIVDDDIELCEMLAEYLGTEGFTVDVVQDGERDAQQALSDSYDVVVLDVMLPKLNGFDALRRIRAESKTPILMLTARGDDVDRIVGLEMGADDYLPKSCNPRELVARLRAILRRMHQSHFSHGEVRRNTILCVGEIEVHPASRHVMRTGETLELTSTEYNLLEVLVRNAGQVVTKEALSELALGRKLARYDRSVDMHLSKLRRKLGTGPAGQPFIQTVRGVGYQFTGV
ncbi:MAG: response regulator transcription factor [Candidatus Thiodiazotropha sp. (ex Lucinoma borealis)]|nr:response regulator transcription factor [Candidatus Thiodiazotropha sp. (ex Lucinoma borealis)]